MLLSNRELKQTSYKLELEHSLRDKIVKSIFNTSLGINSEIDSEIDNTFLTKI